MFLSSLQPSFNALELSGDHGISCERTAIETELHYLPGFDANNLSVDVTGPYIVLEGAVASLADVSRAERVAREIVGADRVICRLVAVGNLGRPAHIS